MLGLTRVFRILERAGKVTKSKTLRSTRLHNEKLWHIACPAVVAKHNVLPTESPRRRFVGIDSQTGNVFSLKRVWLFSLSLPATGGSQHAVRPCSHLPELLPASAR